MSDLSTSTFSHFHLVINYSKNKPSALPSNAQIFLWLQKQISAPLHSLQLLSMVFAHQETTLSSLHILLQPQPCKHSEVSSNFSHTPSHFSTWSKDSDSVDPDPTYRHQWHVMPVTSNLWPLTVLLCKGRQVEGQRALDSDFSLFFFTLFSSVLLCSWKLLVVLWGWGLAVSSHKKDKVSFCELFVSVKQISRQK